MLLLEEARRGVLQGQQQPSALPCRPAATLHPPTTIRRSHLGKPKVPQLGIALGVEQYVLWL